MMGSTVEVTELSLEFNGDYKAQMDEVTSLLEAMTPYLTREQRISLIGEVTDAYVNQVGERPDGNVLYRMGNMILHEELSDNRPNKAQDDYSILSEGQLNARREGRERKRRKKTGVVYREVPMKHASNVATDGKDYTLPIRNFRNPF